MRHWVKILLKGFDIEVKPVDSWEDACFQPANELNELWLV